MLLDVCYEEYMTVDENYCGEYVSLSSTCVLLDVVVNHWIVVVYYGNRHRCNIPFQIGAPEEEA
jgi:hypothetical protein